MSAASLWGKHRPLARTIAARYNAPGWGRDDIVQEAEIALWQAAISFDPERSSFPTYARLVVERRLQTCVTQARAGKHQVLTLSVRELVGEDGVDQALETLPYLHQVCDRAEEREQMVFLLQAIGRLSDEEQTVVLGIASGLTYLELGDRKHVDNVAYRARHKLRKEMDAWAA